MPPPSPETALVWFRRDLRMADHAPLAVALTAAARVHCVFVFDRDILDPLADRRDRRVAFIHAAVGALRQRLRAAGGDLFVLHDQARTAIPALARRLGAGAVFAGRDYDVQRDFPGVRGVSYLSVHLRFGTLSVRECVRLALASGAREDPRWGAAVWLGELIWRDFFFQVLDHHPHVVHAAFRPEYDRVRWVSDPVLRERRLAAWREGRTGYPLVDAAMRQLNATGYMHNRLRMVTASFFAKHLGLDWRTGERVFAERLIDYDLAANNGGWQWAASTGCDAQPYFRIFNPVAQSRRFDPKGMFIRRYVPELAQLSDAAIHAPWEAPVEALATAGIRLGHDYPEPLVDHATARTEALARYGEALGR